MLASVVGFVSCKKDDNTGDDNNGVDTSKKEKLLTQVKMTTPLSAKVIDASYNDALNLDKVKSSSDGSIVSVKKYNYNGSLLVDCKWYSDEAMTNQIGSNSYTFNASGQLTKMIEIDGADTITYTVSWNSGKISEYTAINASAPFTDTRHVFEWTGDNVTKETLYERDSTGNFVSAGYNIFTLDDKINPYTIKYIPELEDVSFFNKNNILKIENFDPSGNPIAITTFTYVYDDKGYPVTGTFDYGYISGQYEFKYGEFSKQ